MDESAYMAQLLKADSLPSAVINAWLPRITPSKVINYSLTGWDPVGAAALAVAKTSWQHAVATACHTKDPDVLDRLARFTSVNVRRAVATNTALRADTRLTMYHKFRKATDQTASSVARLLPFHMRIDLALAEGQTRTAAAEFLFAAFNELPMSKATLRRALVRTAVTEPTRLDKLIAESAVIAFFELNHANPKRVAEGLTILSEEVPSGVLADNVSELTKAFGPGNVAVRYSGPTSFALVAVVRAFDTTSVINEGSLALHRTARDLFPDVYARLDASWERSPTQARMVISKFASLDVLDRFADEFPTYARMLSRSHEFPAQRINSTIANPQMGHDSLLKLFEAHRSNLDLDQLEALQDRLEDSQHSLPFLASLPNMPFDMLKRTVSNAVAGQIASWVTGSAATRPRPGQVAVLLPVWIASQGNSTASRLVTEMNSRFRTDKITPEVFFEMIAGFGPNWYSALRSMTPHVLTDSSPVDLIAQMITQNLGDSPEAWSRAIAMMAANTAVDLTTVMTTAAAISGVTPTEPPKTDVPLVDIPNVIGRQTVLAL